MYCLGLPEERPVEKPDAIVRSSNKSDDVCNESLNSIHSVTVQIHLQEDRK